MRISDWSSDVCSSDLQTEADRCPRSRRRAASARYRCAVIEIARRAASLRPGQDAAADHLPSGLSAAQSAREGQELGRSQEDPSNAGTHGVSAQPESAWRLYPMQDRKSTRLNSSN